MPTVTVVVTAATIVVATDITAVGVVTMVDMAVTIIVATAVGVVTMGNMCIMYIVGTVVGAGDGLVVDVVIVVIVGPFFTESFQYLVVIHTYGRRVMITSRPDYRILRLSLRMRVSSWHFS